MPSLAYFMSVRRADERDAKATCSCRPVSTEKAVRKSANLSRGAMGNCLPLRTNINAEGTTVAVRDARAPVCLFLEDALPVVWQVALDDFAMRHSSSDRLDELVAEPNGFLQQVTAKTIVFHLQSLGSSAQPSILLLEGSHSNCQVLSCGHAVRRNRQANHIRNPLRCRRVDSLSVAHRAPSMCQKRLNTWQSATFGERGLNELDCG